MPSTNQNVNIVINAKDKTKAAFSGLKNNLVGVAAALATLKVGFEVLSDIVQVGAESERQWLAVAGALKRHNIEVTTGLEEIRKFADEMQTLTGVSDEVVAKGIQKFIDFGASIAEAKEEMRVATDLAVGSGISLSSAVDLISKAQVGYTSTLSRYGIIIDEAIPANKKFAAAIEQINEKFGGAAQDVAKSFSVQMKVLSERFGDLKEDIFRLLLPALKVLLEGFIGVVKIVKSVISFFGDLAGAAKNLGEPILILKKEIETATGVTADWVTELNNLDTAFGDAAESSKENGEIIGNFFANIASEVVGILQFMANGLKDLVNLINSIGLTISQALVDAVVVLATTNYSDLLEGILSGSKKWARENEKIVKSQTGVAEAVTRTVADLVPLQDTLNTTNGISLGFTETSNKLGEVVEENAVKVVETGIPAWRMLEETISELGVEMNDFADAQAEINQQLIDDWLEKWQFLQDATFEIFDTLTQTIISNTNNLGENLKRTFEQIGKQIVRTFVTLGVKKLFEYIAGVKAATTEQGKQLAATVAQTAAASAGAIASAVASTALAVQAAAANALADALWDAVAAQAALSLGATVIPSLAAAGAIVAGREALTGGSPATTNFIQGEISPDRAPAAGGISLTFTGPVTDGSFINDVVVPAIEQANLDGFARFNTDDLNITGESPIAFA